MSLEFAFIRMIRWQDLPSASFHQKSSGYDA